MIIVSVICLGLALYLYKKKEAAGDGSMNSGNGSGVGLYGKSACNPTDKSYIATKWFMILLIPIFPLGSYRVIKGESKESVLPPGASITLYGKTTSYQMVKVKLNWRQVITTYFITIVILGVLVYLASLLF
jgi:hypothetical protein